MSLPLHIEGPYLKDSSGNIIQLRGFDHQGIWLSPYLDWSHKANDYEGFREITRGAKTIGLNHIAIDMYYGYWLLSLRGETGYEQAIPDIDRMVNILTQEGLYTFFRCYFGQWPWGSGQYDQDRIRDNGPAVFSDQPDARSELYYFYKNIMGRYALNPNVLGINLWVEPDPRGFPTNIQDEVFKEATEEIQSVANNKISIIPTWTFFDLTRFPYPYPNCMYYFHRFFHQDFAHWYMGGEMRLRLPHVHIYLPPQFGGTSEPKDWQYARQVLRDSHEYDNNLFSAMNAGLCILMDEGGFLGEYCLSYEEATKKTPPYFYEPNWAQAIQDYFSLYNELGVNWTIFTLTSGGGGYGLYVDYPMFDYNTQTWLEKPVSFDKTEKARIWRQYANGDTRLLPLSMQTSFEQETPRRMDYTSVPPQGFQQIDVGDGVGGGYIEIVDDLAQAQHGSKCSYHWAPPAATTNMWCLLMTGGVAELRNLYASWWQRFDSLPPSEWKEYGIFYYNNTLYQELFKILVRLRNGQTNFVLTKMWGTPDMEIPYPIQRNAWYHFEAECLVDSYNGYYFLKVNGNEIFRRTELDTHPPSGFLLPRYYEAGINNTDRENTYAAWTDNYEFRGSVQPLGEIEKHLVTITSSPITGVPFTVRRL